MLSGIDPVKMKSNNTTSHVYRWIVDDVIAKMKAEFVQEGVEEGVLDELRQQWEGKLIQNKLIGDGDNEGPTFESNKAAEPGPSATDFKREPALPMPVFELNPTQAWSLSPFGGEASRKRKQPDSEPQLESLSRGLYHPQAGTEHFNLIPQHDGPADDGTNEDPEDAEAAGTAEDGDAEQPAEDEILSEDSEAEEEEEDVENFLCCQFEKVNRTKNRWKISMRDGVFHINGKDYLFKKANGEWLF